VIGEFVDYIITLDLVSLGSIMRQITGRLVFIPKGDEVFICAIIGPEIIDQDRENLNYLKIKKTNT